MKAYWALLIPVCVAALLGGGVLGVRSVRSLPTDSSDPIVEYSSTIDVPTYYQSIAAVAGDSELVIHAVAGEANSFKYHGDMNVTMTQVSIKQVFRDRGTGSPTTVRVVEQGGPATATQPSSVMAPGKEYVLFLHRPLTHPDPQLPADTYVISGSYMGKFSVLPGGALQLTVPTREIRALAAEARVTKLRDLPGKMPR